MKYNVGDKVMVKTWEQMAEEYGSREYSISTPIYSFIIDMKDFCGTVQTIKKVLEDSYYCEGQPWRFTDEMLLPYKAVETNAEHYKDEIWKIIMSGNNFGVEKDVPKSCIDIPCLKCDFRTSEGECKICRKKWLNAPYEKKVDWSKVAVDTKILVKHLKEDDEWVNRHFAKYENGRVHAWSDGGTSWTSESTISWSYAKLAEEE